MGRTISLYNTQTGSIAGIVLLILTILSLIGFAALYSSNTELLTAGNEVVFKQNIYKAEAGVVENAERLETSDGEGLLDSSNFQWLNNSGALPNEADIINPDNWTDVFSQTSIDSNVRFLTVSEGIVPGGSLDMSHSQVRAYSIYGRCKSNNGLTVIRVGYRRAF